MRKYQLTDEMSKLVKQDAYEIWLSRKASSHRRRDNKRGNTKATVEKYKIAIHQAVCKSKGYDAYTGEMLDWKKISQYNNEESKKLKRKYKKKFANLPTVDHVGDGLGKPKFEICSWKVNDAKHDLSYKEFVELCKQVVRFAKKKK